MAAAQTAGAPALGRDEALALLRTMWRIRLFEERVAQMRSA